ncbi:fatty-acyl coenzyme A oxidase [Balamuthia mandrillaris]
MEGRGARAALQRLGTVAGHLQPSPTSSSAAALLDTHDGRAILEQERNSARFDVLSMTHFLNGGAEITAVKDEMNKLLEHDEILLDKGFYDRTRPEARERVMRKMKRYVEVKTNDLLKAKILWDSIALYDPSFGIRLGVHAVLFGGAISGQGTKEQRARWLEDVQNLRIIGCFSMTEMGHGSAIRHFETTAVFDKATDEFVINTPTITATKWWIGGAAHLATHTIAFARLIIDGKDYGVHSFVVPLRNIDGSLKPNITVGDCGKKMGMDGIDNGFVQFHNVRVPRTNMLMKWAKVTPQGEYIKPPKAQLAYGALLGGRISLINNANLNLEKALTIAIRYSAIRKQFEVKKGGPEVPILDYKTHQVRLLEPLAGLYAWILTERMLSKKNADLQARLAEGDISGLPDLHASSSGLKACCTWFVHGAIETARQCMGGHGYSAYSALPTLVSDFAINCTWEGDNTVMLLQTARYLVKSLRKAMQGQELVGSVSYLQRIQSILSRERCSAATVDDFSQTELIMEAMERAACVKVAHAARLMQQEMQNGKKPGEAWNECLTDLVQAAEYHSFLWITNAFLTGIQDVQDASLRGVLHQLFELFALSRMQKTIAVYLQDGYMQQSHVEMISQRLRTLLRELRPQAVPLVDAFRLPDYILNSPLGRYDGDVYHHYLETVKQAPGCFGVAPYWNELVRPCLREDL